MPFVQSLADNYGVAEITMVDLACPGGDREKGTLRAPLNGELVDRQIKELQAARPGVTFKFPADPLAKDAEETAAERKLRRRISQ